MRPLKVLGILIGIAGLVLIFQNCGDVRVRTLEVPQVLESAALEGKICPIAGQEFGLSGRTLIVMDMSLSNLGGYDMVPQQVGGRTYYDFTLGFQIYNPNDPDTFIFKPSDKDGVRFTVANQLIQALQQNLNMKYSVIGFHDAVVMRDQAESCTSPMTDSNSALASVNYLLTVHNADKNDPSRRETTENNPFNMKNTSYQSAINCLQEKIDKDILNNSNASLNTYNIIFLTDGKPTDTQDPCSATDTACRTATPYFNQCRALSDAAKRECFGRVFSERHYAEVLTAFKNLTVNEVAKIRLYPVFYGEPPAVLPVTEAECLASDYCLAIRALDKLAQVFDPNAVTQRRGPGDPLEKLYEFKNEILEAIDSRVTTSYVVRNVTAVNLTAVIRNGKVLADSNMNGIADEAESSMPTQQNLRQIFNGFTSLNQDMDLLPSFIEKIRDLNVDAEDSSNDMDGDGLSNFEEVVAGTPANQSELRFPTPDMYKTRLRSVMDPNNLCDLVTPQVSFGLSNIGLAENVQDYLDEEPGPLGLNFSHSGGDNLLLVTYEAVPSSGGDSQKSYLYGAVIPFKAGMSESKLLRSEDFKALGELQ